MKANEENKLSVIVPVYNVREYVEECVESILNQTYTNLEVLLIINAPTDGSDKICERYEEKDRRIRLIYIPENHGVYQAWYTGGMNATGDYVTFVDGDDYIDADYLKNMMDMIAECDMVASSHTRVTNTSLYKEHFRGSPGIYSYDMGRDHDINEILLAMQDDDYFIFPGPWGKVYKAEIIKEVFNEIGQDPPGYLRGGGDRAIAFTAFLKCNSIKIVESFGYKYRLRQGSEGRRVRINYIGEVNEYYICMKKIFEKDSRKDIFIDLLQKYILRRTLDAGFQMGFSEKNCLQQFFIPFPEKIRGKKIALYSAHITGIDYYHQICRQELCNLSVWVSRNWTQKRQMGLPVKSVEELLKTDFEYVVVAVTRESTAQGIKKELMALGVEEHKILWEKPIHILD